MTLPKHRFAEPEVLTEETLVLGVPLKEWNKAFIGSFEKSLGGKNARDHVNDEGEPIPLHQKTQKTP